MNRIFPDCNETLKRDGRSPGRILDERNRRGIGPGQDTKGIFNDLNDLYLRIFHCSP